MFEQNSPHAFENHAGPWEAFCADISNLQEAAEKADEWIEKGVFPAEDRETAIGYALEFFFERRNRK